MGQIQSTGIKVSSIIIFLCCFCSRKWKCCCFIMCCLLGSARSESSHGGYGIPKGGGVIFLPSFWTEKYETMLKFPAGE